MEPISAYRHAKQGLAVVALEALCHHNSRSVGLPEAFFASAEVFARKWSHRLPVATPCAIIDSGGEVYVLGNAAGGPGSVAIAEKCVRPGRPQASLIATPPWCRSTIVRPCDEVTANLARQCDQLARCHGRLGRDHGS